LVLSAIDKAAWTPAVSHFRHVRQQGIWSYRVYLRSLKEVPMPKGQSLHIGLNLVDADHYAGWEGQLNA
jgi:hypothetical protein